MFPLLIFVCFFLSLSSRGTQNLENKYLYLQEGLALEGLAEETGLDGGGFWTWGPEVLWCHHKDEPVFSTF